MSPCHCALTAAPSRAAPRASSQTAGLATLNGLPSAVPGTRSGCLFIGAQGRDWADGGEGSAAAPNVATSVTAIVPEGLAGPGGGGAKIGGAKGGATLSRRDTGMGPQGQ